MAATALSTIQSYIDRNHTITAYHDAGQSNPCQHGAKLDLIALRDKLGPDYSIPDNHAAFVGMLRCAACGRRANMSIVISPPTR